MNTKKKPALPDVPRPGQNRHNFDTRIKEFLELFSGRRGNKIEKLRDGATLEEAVEKINELIDHFM